MPDTTAYNGDTVMLDLTAVGFDSIVSMQFSVQWDEAILDYLSFERIDLDYVAIGDLQADVGELRLSWFDLAGVGLSLPDGSVVVRLSFKVIGPPGSSTYLPITDEPLAIQIFKATNQPGLYDPIAMEQDTGRVRVISPADVSVVANNPACAGQNDGSFAATINAPAGSIFEWTGPNGFSSDQEDIASLSPGSYTLTIRDQAGEIIFQSSYTLTAPAPLLWQSLVLSEAFCSEPIGSAAAGVTGGTGPYQYNLGNGPQPDSLFSALVAGNYTLVVTDQNNCAIDTAFVIEGPVAPQPGLPDTTTFCTGTTGLLSVGSFTSYNWSSGQSTDSITVSQPGLYAVTVTNAEGCQAADTTLVIFSSNVTVTFSNLVPTVCQGDSIELQVSGAETYAWIDTSGTLSALDIPFPVAKPQFTTLYTVIGTSACGVDTASLEVEVIPVTATAGPDTCIVPGIEIRFEASGGEFYQWAVNDDYPLSNLFIRNPYASPEDSTTYVVTIIDSSGCIVIDSVHVMVSTGPLNITPINMITPNGDDKNDDLYFGSIGKYGQNTLKVYNRWGDLVYQKVGYQSDDERFDGTYRGEPLPAGTYFYVLSFKTGTLKQALTIVRD